MLSLIVVGLLAMIAIGIGCMNVVSGVRFRDAPETFYIAGALFVCSLIILW